jgi:hypothetical protein
MQPALVRQRLIVADLFSPVISAYMSSLSLKRLHHGCVAFRWNQCRFVPALICSGVNTWPSAVAVLWRVPPYRSTSLIPRLSHTFFHHFHKYL